MIDTYTEARAYGKMRDTAIIQTIRNGCTAWIKAIYRHNHLPIPSDMMLMETACKYAISIGYMPEDVVGKAKQWLYEHDYSEEIGEN